VRMYRMSGPRTRKGKDYYSQKKALYSKLHKWNKNLGEVSTGVLPKGQDIFLLISK